MHRLPWSRQPQLEGPIVECYRSNELRADGGLRWANWERAGTKERQKQSSRYQSLDTSPSLLGCLRSRKTQNMKMGKVTRGLPPFANTPVLCDNRMPQTETCPNQELRVVCVRFCNLRSLDSPDHFEQLTKPLKLEVSFLSFPYVALEEVGLTAPKRECLPGVQI